MKNSKWLKFTILYLGAMVLSISQMKLSPTKLGDAFNLLTGITDFQSSIYRAVFAIAPVLLAIPGGSLVKRYGAKRISLVIMIALVLGNAIGYMSNSFAVLLTARIIEGISFSFIMITGLVLITNWFKDGSYGLAVGIFGTFSAFGYVAVIYGLPLIYDFWGLKSIWLVLSILSVAITICFYMFFDDVRSEVSEKKSSLKEAIGNSKIVLLALAMFTVSFVLFMFLNKYPTIFRDIYNLNHSTQSFYSMYFGLIGIPFGFLVGYLIDKTGKPLTVAFFSFIGLAVACFFTDKTTASLLILQVTLLSGCISFTSSSISASVPRIVKHSGLIEDSFAFIYLFYYIGVLLGDPIISGLASSFGWGWAIIVLTLIAAMGAVITFSFSIREKKVVKA